ncbi:hypothetical protein EYF80_028282 [Liparis tanakae]|uniref:Uncharacterized protein n=1 Tax=Liparis tanakae TaxID=230148 RepID=A0A4Z2H6J8_9TELE|nr:hypothetical protein EYF80_028282 [Liparis tanakae]
MGLSARSPEESVVHGKNRLKRKKRNFTPWIQIRHQPPHVVEGVQVEQSQTLLKLHGALGPPAALRVPETLTPGVCLGRPLTLL